MLNFSAKQSVSHPEQAFPQTHDSSHSHTNLGSPPQVVQRRVDLLQQEGIQFRVKVEVGKDVLAKDLMKENDAVLLALGATWPRDLPIPGEEVS